MKQQILTNYVSLGSIDGTDLIGCKVSCPWSVYSVVYVLPKKEEILLVILHTCLLI